MMKGMRTIAVWVACALALLGMAVPALAVAPAIEEADYKGSGVVEVDFLQDVRYKGAKVTVKDATGKRYAARITKKDEDDLKFKVSGLAAGKSYSFTISGVKAERTKGYGSVSGSFAVPSAQKPQIQGVEYKGSGVVEVDFLQDVRYKGAKVTVKDATGKRYAARITKKDEDDLKFKVSRLASGKSYSFTISGVGVKKSEGYASVSGSFSLPKVDALRVRQVEYDHDDRELCFEFSGRVGYSGAKVTVKDSAGRSISARVVEREDDELTVRLGKRLTRGKRYTYTITGVRPVGGAAARLSGSFTAYDD